MYVDNPGYYTKINLLEDTDAKVYHQALTAVLTDNVFQEQLAEKLKDYDKRMVEISEDLKKIDAEI
jgi:phosphopantetheine adenylyltransferase